MPDQYPDLEFIGNVRYFWAIHNGCFDIMRSNYRSSAVLLNPVDYFGVTEIKMWAHKPN